ncbi:MAG: hypothetical protein GVY19_04115 [Bacteroidetes bacterium]|jgi:anti-sigma factor RsiW|nr:hypothetical protein [Bacteroidota bacterium]
MKCAEVQNKFIALQDGMLNPVEKHKIEEHLQTCNKCQWLYAMLTKTDQYMAYEKQQRSPDFLANRILASLPTHAAKQSINLQLTRLQKIAALLLVAIGLASGWLLGNMVYTTDHSFSTSVTDEFNLGSDIGAFEAFLLNQ